MKRKILSFLTLLCMVTALLSANITVFAATTVYVSSVSEFQSEHPYSNNMDKTWIYTHSTSADNLEITFSSDTEVESNYDFIYILDGSGNQVGKYTGTTLADKTVTVPGNVVKIRLTSDVSVQKNGFTVTSVVPISDETEDENIIDSGTCGENLTYMLNDSGTLTVS